MASAVSRAALILAVTLMVVLCHATPATAAAAATPSEDQVLFEQAEQMAKELGLDLEEGAEEEGEEEVEPIAEMETEEQEQEQEQEEDDSEVSAEACAGPNPPKGCTKYGRAHFRNQIRSARRQIRRLDAKIARANASGKQDPKPSSAAPAAAAVPRAAAAAAPPKTIVHLPDLSDLLKRLLTEMERGERNRGCKDRLNKMYKLFRFVAKSWTDHRKELLKALAREETQKDGIRQGVRRLRNKLAQSKKKARLLRKFARKLAKYYRHKASISKTQYAIQKRVNVRILKDVAALRGQLKSARTRIAKLKDQNKKQAEKSKKIIAELKKEIKYEKLASAKAKKEADDAKKQRDAAAAAKKPSTPAPTPAPTVAPAAQTYAPFQRESLQGQILAEAACTAINPGGWTFAVRRTCSSTAPPCTEICAKAVDAQAGKLMAINALHIYENQPARATGQIGLKVHRYNQVGGSYCGPNYCCCAPATSATATALVQENLETEHDMNVQHEDGEDEASLRAVSDKDLELLDLADSVAVGGIRPSGFAYDGLSGQVLAQSICVGLNKQGGWTYAVRRVCSAAAPNCFQVCNALAETSGGQLQSFNTLHVYAANTEATADGVTGLKTYRYNSVDAGGCGPDYCCCRGSVANAPAPQLLLEEGEDEEEEEEEEAMMGSSVFNSNMLDGQIQAEAVATAVAPSSQAGWSFAVRRDCTANNAQTCEQLCSSMTESQVAGSNTPHLYCLDALHVATSQPSPAVSQVGLKTFRYGRAGCQTTGCGPNYCLCWGGYNNVKPQV